MANYPNTIILRHRRENLKKCSLTGLENREDIEFYTYPTHHLPQKNGYILLSFDGKELSKDDMGKGIYLIDGTWKLAEKMLKTLPFKPEIRSLPKHFKTAYPRRQTACANPEEGLASIEALFAAYCILGRESLSLLNNYPFKEQFLNKNINTNC